MSNRDRAAEIIEPWIEKKSGHPEDNAAAAADDLAAAGILSGGQYVELAPEHRYAVARTKEQIIISDNEARTTLYVPLHHVNDLVHGLLLAQAHEGNNGGANP